MPKSKNPPEESSTYSHAISAEEFYQAKLFWIRTMQASLFPIELISLQHQHRPLPRKSAILSLNPFIDNDKVIRVGGRLRNSSLSFRSKHPILLAVHPITHLIVRYMHVTTLHAGTQLTLAALRQEFWVLKSRSLVKSIIGKCVACTRERAQTLGQLIGQLPPHRVTAPSRAFIHCGVDYAGPVNTRASAG